MSAATRLALAAYVPARTRAWEEFSRLFVVGDDIGWSIDDDRSRLIATAERLGYEVAPSPWARFARRQSVFAHEHFGALQPRWLESSHRLGLSYFHGRPGTPGYPEFDRAYDTLSKHAARIDRVQVTNGEMQELVDLEHFPPVDDASRRTARAELGIPESAFVVGSFQKDGVGFGAGDEPKTIKGPDVLVTVLERLRIPELFVLLTGPARGYVRSALERANVPYRHVQPSSRAALGRAYQALDAYVVTSRQEGGPKSVLEAMAAGVPLVSTRVGQAPEIVRDGENGLLADVDDVDALVAAVTRVHAGVDFRDAARSTAEVHAEERLDPLWAALLDGFVSREA
jgi:glycosyltransferase involved in cell wall biosynthesis